MIKKIHCHVTLASLLLATSAQASLKQYQFSSLADESTPLHCEDVNVEPEDLCQLPTDKRSPVFLTDPVIAGAIQLDIRPAGCQSFFDDFLHTRRGLRIESALGSSTLYSNYTNTVSNFPIVDFYSNGYIRVVKTRDLTTSSFTGTTNTDGLFNQLIEDAKAINEGLLNKLASGNQISTSSNGVSTTMMENDVQFITLDIVIQTGIASQQQIKQLKKAKKVLAQRWGFHLQIIEIP